MDYLYVQESKEMLTKLLALQWNRYEYDEFVRILKTRIRRYIGKEEVMFYTEAELVHELHELDLVSHFYER